MRKKPALILLSVLSAIGFAFGAAACSNQETPVVTIEGFSIKETMQANAGAVIELEQPIVTDSNGVLLDCWTYVQDANGNYVAVTAGRFTATNVGEYTITYVVRDSANNTYEKQTKLTVVGDASNEEVTLTVDYEQFITVGEEVTIDAVCSAQNAVLSYEVTDYSSGEQLEVLDGKFTPQEAGLYEVLVSVAGGAPTYKYNVFAEQPLQTGEVERFGEAWEEKESFIGGKRQDWQIVDSAETGLLDPYGREASFAKYTTQRNYIPLYLDIREDVEYYEQLAAEGYTYVSMWIYMVSEKPHVTISDRDPNGGFYRRSGPELHPGVWTEFRLDLVTGKNTWYRSFVQCYDYYVNQNYFYLQVDNSNDWNISSKNEFWGAEREITFYFTDVYAVKSVSMLVTDDAQSQAAVKDTVDFDTMFSADFAMDYLVSCRGESTLLSGSEYTFTSNGEYTVQAIPADFNLRGSKTLTMTVSDNHSLSALPVIKERTGESVSVELSDLNAAFSAVEGVTPTIETYKVFFDGKEIAVADGTFVAAKDGAYTVEVKGVYTENGVEYTTYHEVPVDVWSTATKYAVIDTNAMRSIRAWDWDNSSTTAEYGEYTAGGVTGDFVQLTAKGQSLTFYAKPMFSKAYYEALATQNANTMVTMNVYYAPATSASEGKTTNVKSVFTSTTNKTTWGVSYENTWLNFTMPIANFLAQYDQISGAYERLADASYGDDTDGGVGCWLHIIGSAVSRTFYVELGLQIEAQEVDVAINSGAQFLLKQSNDLTDILAVTLDNKSAQITQAEVFFNGEWVALDDLTFAPVWAADYTFRFNLATTDGVYYKNGVEVTFAIGGEAFTATVDQAFYALEIGGTLNVSSMLDDEYDYSVQLVRAGKLVAEFANGIIDTSGLASGAYVVNVYANDGEGAFGKILYYTFTLDVWSAATKYAVLDGNEIRNVRAWDWDSSSTTAEYGEYTVGGTTDQFVKLTARGQSLTFYAKPMYSKGYYEALLAENAELKVLINVYFQPETEGLTTNFRSFYHPNKAEWFDKYNGEWQTYEITLADFIAFYDEIDGKYEQYKNASCGAGTEGYQGTWLQLIGSQVGRTVYVGARVSCEAETAAVSVQEGKQFVLGQDNHLNDVLAATLDDKAARITAASILFNGTWIKLDSLTFAPVWGAEYDFRFDLITEDGVLYKKVVETTLTIGDELFQTTNDTTVYTLQTGETLDIVALLGDEYSYEIELFDNTRGAMSAMSLTGTVLASDELNRGVYFVKVYAIADGAFGRILYYTLTVNNLDSYGTDGVWIEEFTADTYKTIFKSYQYANNQHLTDTIVTEQVPTGNSGTFLKYEGRQGNNKEAMTFAVKPLYSQDFYRLLVDSGKGYTVKFDVFIENVNADCTRTHAYAYSWNDAGTNFTTHGLSLALGQWHTLEIPLDILVNNLSDGEVKFFGVYIPYGGYKTTDWVRMYIGNIRLEEGEMRWSAKTLTTDLLTTYQYANTQNRAYTTLTQEIPEGGVAGTYVQWAQPEASNATKEDIQLAIAPVYAKAYYEDLLASGNDYKITYDVYVTHTSGNYAGSTLNTKLWTKKTDGTDSFSTYGTIGFDAWHTVEIDLSYLVANWGNYRLFGLSFTGGGYERATNRVTFWLGNIQLVEGTASGVATLKA